MNSKSFFLLFVFLLLLTYFNPPVVSQQPYAGKATVNCRISSDNSSSVLGYTCNGLNRTCKSYLIYRANPPYNTVSSISLLLASNPSDVAAINSVPVNTTFTTNKMVIVPVICSCSGDYKFYQKTASYIVQHGDSYYHIVNNRYQGLTTCKSIKAQNSIETVYIYTGTNMTIPLRCSCPTKNQTDKGVKYLVSYVVASGDFVSRISVRFGVDTGRTLAANGLTEESSTIYPFTTLLIPMKDPPSSSQTLTPPPTNSPPPPPPLAALYGGGSARTKWLFAAFGFLAGSAVVLTAGAMVILWVISRSRKVKSIAKIDTRVELKKEDNVEDSQNFVIDKVSSIARSIKLYDFGELQLATGDFSDNALIKGAVYRGTTEDGFVAIKKIDGDVLKEINILNKISHFNLIRLLGISYNNGTWYFAYEYAINGSLADWIHSDASEFVGKTLSWCQRVQIALDVATGLNYLHSFSNPSLIHKNITSSNVLLDSDYRGKISNLSLARSAEGEDGHFDMTRHIVGTRGYLAPEYLKDGLVSTKMDVYAFGVLVMEMITGKEVAAFYSEENPSLVGILNAVLSEKNEVSEEGLSKLIDPSLRDDFPYEIAVWMAELAADCLSKNPAARPSMDEIVPSVSRILMSLMAWEGSKNVC